MINIPYLHEVAILETLYKKYQKNKIYTFNGPILLALNPFKFLPIYSEEIINNFLNKNLVEIKEPHIYSIAKTAYDNLYTFHKNQSVLASGESGSGKTVSTKHLLSFLALLSKKKHKETNCKDTHISNIENKIIACNPILEAFGNAKTIRNDNSSRFGKFIKLYFNPNGILIGGEIETYLLEKIRLISQNNGKERNFHIFYQSLQSKLNLKKFNYINNKDILNRDDGITDKDENDNMISAMKIMQFSDEFIINILNIINGILNLGNLNLNESDNESSGTKCTEIVDSEEFSSVLDLLGFNKDSFKNALTLKKIKTGNEEFISTLEKEKVEDYINSLSMFLYESLFKLIVSRINDVISEKKSNRWVGLLDIFGFEVFAENKLEQLCINFANEKLQHQFNNHIFKLEQELYKKEGIEWTNVDFPDNSLRLKLIDRKSNGILSLLDEQCIVPRGNDNTLLNNYYKNFKEKIKKEKEIEKELENDLESKIASYFYGNASLKRSSKFAINHYAGLVEYSVDGFCHKNKNQVKPEILELIKNSSNEIISKDLHSYLGNTSRRTSTIRSKSLTSQFNEQLNNLIKIISSTMPQYIRCLKPNDENISDNFDKKRIEEQLTYSGVLEAVKVSRAGFPVRLSFEEYMDRYYMFQTKSGQIIIKKYTDKKLIQNGKTKIFFKKRSFPEFRS